MGCFNEPRRLHHLREVLRFVFAVVFALLPVDCFDLENALKLFVWTGGTSINAEFSLFEERLADAHAVVQPQSRAARRIARSVEHSEQVQHVVWVDPLANVADSELEQLLVL